MKKFLFLLFTGFICVSTQPVFAMSQADAYKAEFQFNKGAGISINKLGTKVIRDEVHDLVVQYDFSIDGGAVASGGIKLRSPLTQGSAGSVSATLPKGSVIIGCYVDVITAGTTSASGTMAISSGQGAGDLVTATAAASYTGIVACTPVGTAATAIKLTADSVPYAVIATGALTAGKWNVHIQYVLSDM
jgi:hypothetical protein